jgi:hypothetical protein
MTCAAGKSLMASSISGSVLMGAFASTQTGRLKGKAAAGVPRVPLLAARVPPLLHCHRVIGAAAGLESLAGAEAETGGVVHHFDAGVISGIASRRLRR